MVWFPQNGFLRIPGNCMLQLQCYGITYDVTRLLTLASLPVVKAYLSQKTRPFAASLRFFLESLKIMRTGDFMMICGDLWRFIVVHDDLWWCMVIYGALWSFIVTYGDLWWNHHKEIWSKHRGSGIDWFTFMVWNKVGLEIRDSMKNRKRE